MAARGARPLGGGDLRWRHEPPLVAGFRLPPSADPLEIALAEIEVAIELVRRGQARRVRLVGLVGGRATPRASGLRGPRTAGVAVRP